MPATGQGLYFRLEHPLGGIALIHCWPRYLLWLIIALLGTGQLLTACGQKGPLYLPEPPAAESTISDEVPEVPPADPEDLEREAAQSIETAL